MKARKMYEHANRPQLTYTAYLMVTAMEEASEIEQALSKSLRFGVESGGEVLRHERVNTNGEHVMKEFYQLMATITMLQGLGVLPKLDDAQIKEIKADKRHKVKEYAKVSERMGCIIAPTGDGLN